MAPSAAVTMECGGVYKMLTFRINVTCVPGSLPGARDALESPPPQVSLGPQSCLPAILSWGETPVSQASARDGDLRAARGALTAT